MPAMISAATRSLPNARIVKFSPRPGTAARAMKLGVRKRIRANGLIWLRLKRLRSVFHGMATLVRARCFPVDTVGHFQLQGGSLSRTGELPNEESVLAGLVPRRVSLVAPRGAA